MSGKKAKKVSKEQRKKAQGEIAEATPDSKAVLSEPPREVRRIHLWRPGHDPNDPDAYPESGWQYATLRLPESETANKTDRHTLGGGPESGWPCTQCGEMTRIVDDYDVLTVLEQSFNLNDEQKEQVKDKSLLVLICPKCENLVHFRKEYLEPMREAWLKKKVANQ